VLGELEEALGQQQAVIGIGQTLDALNQRRARRLILDRSFAATGRRCPLDGLLYAAGTDVCPSDGNPTEATDLREALVEAAVLQDADLAIVGEGNEVPAAVLVRGQGVAALLRF
jgi:peptide subunit release factor 1 (eRF1)